MFGKIQIGRQLRRQLVASALLLFAPTLSKAALRSWLLPAETDITHLCHLRTQGADLLVAPAGQHVYVYAYQNQSWTNVGILNSPYGDILTVALTRGSSNRFVSCLSTGGVDRYIAFHDLVNSGGAWSWVEAGRAPLPTNTASRIYLYEAGMTGAILQRNGDSHTYLARLAEPPVDLGPDPSNYWWCPAGWLWLASQDIDDSRLFTLALRAAGTGSLIASSTNRTTRSGGDVRVLSDGVWLLNTETGQIARLAFTNLHPDRTIQVTSNIFNGQVLPDFSGGVWAVTAASTPDDGVSIVNRYGVTDAPLGSRLTVYPEIRRISESGNFVLALGGGSTPSAGCSLYDWHDGSLVARRVFGDSGPAVDWLVVQTADGAEFAVKACFFWDGLEVEECGPSLGPWQAPQRFQTTPTNRILVLGTTSVGSTATLVIDITNSVGSSWNLFALMEALPVASACPFSMSGPRSITVSTNGTNIVVAYSPTWLGVHYSSLRFENKAMSSYDEFLLMGQTTGSPPSEYSPVMITGTWLDSTGAMRVAFANESEALASFRLAASEGPLLSPSTTTILPTRISHRLREFTLPSPQSSALFLNVSGADIP